jgi:protein subunit release factor A
MTKLFSVTKKDFVRQTFRSGGKGGQNQNKVESGVRLIHPPSGARGEARDSRDQKRNEISAFERLVATKQFQMWLRIEIARKMGQRLPETPEEIYARIDQTIEDGLKNGEIVVEEV